MEKKIIVTLDDGDTGTPNAQGLSSRPISLDENGLVRGLEYGEYGKIIGSWEVEAER